MRFVVITGPSGAGKTLALHSFEDAGYYTVDNLPPRLLPELVAFCRETAQEMGAVVMDIRSGAAFAELGEVMQGLHQAGVCIELLYLDASDAALVNRFKETRRPHPLLTETTAVGVIEALHEERRLLHTARTLADRILDTSALTPWELRDHLHSTYSQDTRPGLLVTVTSFGFKHGLPLDADLVFDVRFLANPHYVPELKGMTGRDAEVAAYIHADPRTKSFQERMNGLVQFTLPEYEREGKVYLNITIGCTGGQHRSVVLAEELAALLTRESYRVSVRHRDIKKSRTEESGRSLQAEEVIAGQCDLDSSEVTL